MKRFIIYLFLIVFLSCTSLSLSEPSNNPVAERLEGLLDHLNDLNSLKFHFTQNTSGQLSGRSRLASGDAILIRTPEGPRMRWDYLVPDTQVIINDGATLTMYFEKLKQMIISPAESLQQDIIFQFFTGEADISGNFTFEQLVSEQDLTTDTGEMFDIIKLTPVVAGNLQSLTLWITQKNQIKRIEIVDSFDTLTLLSLSSVEENNLKIESAHGLFHFTPPPDTEIIRQ